MIERGRGEAAEDNRGKKTREESFFRVFRVFCGSFLLCSNRCSPSSFVAVLLALLFVGALFWAKGQDPFQRIWFKVRVPGQGKAECIAVLPKMAARPLPVVVYLHGSGGDLLGDGNELRQIAEMGLAAVGMDYCQTNEAAFDAQFSALLAYLRREPWADTNRVAWVGFSLGAQRSLAFALRHPERTPKLLVRLAGGWVPELESEVRSQRPELRGRKSEGLSTLSSQLSTAVLLIHGENDEVFPLAQARRVAACLRTNGIPVELKVLPGEGHGFGANHLLVFRVIGEQCLTRLKGPDALNNYRSILSWQAQARPLWLFWVPAFAWAVVWLWLRHKAGQASRLLSEPKAVAQASRLPPAANEVQEQSKTGGTPAPLLRWLAAVLAMAALGLTALHLVPPRLAVSDFTLSIARQHLVQTKEMRDFEFLAGEPAWRGKPLKTLLEHVELAHYNRELINWKLDEQAYRDFVLSPQIDPASDGGLNWRRPLWENFYPRIRREQDPAAAAEIVVRFLRERVTIAQGDNLPSVVAEIWQRQITNERGFEAVYVAALRSVGIPSRLAPQGRAEFWTGSGWQAAPRPLVEGWQ
jgi:dienelactone hydrolase